MRQNEQQTSPFRAGGGQRIDRGEEKIKIALLHLERALEGLLI